MCRPSCCDNSRGQGTGIAAVAVIVGAALIAAKIGPIVAEIIRVALEVLRIAALTAGAVLALAVLTWLTMTIARWWLRHRSAQQRKAFAPVVAREPFQPAGNRIGCLACGDTGKVLRLTDGSHYQPDSCPVCEPVRWAG
jgi:hypothetical protein